MDHGPSSPAEEQIPAACMAWLCDVSACDGIEVPFEKVDQKP
jgi:hypothetical protein